MRRVLLLASAISVWQAPLCASLPDAPLPSPAVASPIMQADALNDAGRYADAEPLYRQALQQSRQTLGENRPETAQAYDALASNLSLQGKYAEADGYFRKSLGIVRALLGDNNVTTAASYNNLAANLYAQQRFAEAEPLYRRALEIELKLLGATHPDVATAYNNLAANLTELGRNKEADELHLKALAIDGATGGEARRETAVRYNSMGYSLYSQGRYQEADSYYRKALDINLKLLGENHPETAMNYNNLASNLVRQKQYGEAEPLYRKAVEIDRAVLGENHPDTAISYSNLATNLNDQRRYADAEAMSAIAVQAARRAEYIGMGGGKGAADQAGSNGITLRDVFNDYLGIAWNLSSQNPGEKARLRANAFRTAQDAMGSAAALAMAQAASRTASGKDDLARAVREEQDLASLAMSLDRKLLVALGQGNGAQATQLKADYDAAIMKLEAAGTRIDRDFPAYRELVSPKPLDIAEVQKALAPDEGLLLMLTSGSAIYSFAVTPANVTWNRIGADQVKQVMANIVRLRCEVDWKTCPVEEQDELDRMPLTRFEDQLFRRYDLDRAYAIYQQLIAPVAPALKGAKRLYVTSSGALGDLPVAMLVESAPPARADMADPNLLLNAKWLGDRFAVTTLPAVSALRLKTVRTGAQHNGGSFRGYGDPLLDGTNLPDGGYGFFRGASDGSSLADPGTIQTLMPLPGTRTELTAMAGLFGSTDGTLQLGTMATESALRRDKLIQSAGVIAFATHGLLPSPQFKLDEPGLVFTPPAKPSASDDGILTASEASALTLSAEWVILSACNTASSANGAGGSDNLSALSRGFLYAGAKALLASHWRVSDEATAALTVETLSARRNNPGLTRAQALQQAMKSIRTGHRPDGSDVPGWSQDWVHPSAWAAFSHIANQDD